MNGKKSPILICILVVVLIALAVFGYVILSKGGTGGGSKEQKNLIAPEIELKLSSEEPDLDKVIITVSATTMDEEGIASITLPDKTTVNGSSKDYEVTKNGTYSFTVTGTNGKSTSSQITVSNIKSISADNPYIPEGFEHIGGTVESGYVIEDSLNNQFVWIPVYSGLLTRDMNQSFIESSGSGTELVSSVAKNYGFYIARFEASQYDINGTKVAASRGGQNPWTNITFLEAQQAANDMAKAFSYGKDVSTALVNSYAWDTTLEWLGKTHDNYASSTSYGNYSGTVLPCGQTQSDIVNNICDMAGNIREWTTETDNTVVQDPNVKKTTKIQDDEIIRHVVRGGSAILNRTAGSRIGYSENLSDDYWGFRVILYK